MASLRRLFRSCLGAGSVALLLVGCGVQPQPFANGSVVSAGPVAVALAVAPNPARVGRPVTLDFTLRENNSPLAANGATLQLTTDMPKMGMSLPAIPLRNVGAGQWQAQYTFPMAGGWSATLRVTPTNGSAADAAFTFDVGP